MIKAKKQLGKLEYDTVELDKLILQLPDGEYFIEFSPVDAEHTLQQIKYCRGHIYPVFAEHAASGSETPQWWHERLTLKFLSTEIIEDDKIITVAKTTKLQGGCTKAEYTQYIKDIIQYGLEVWGVEISDPT